MPEPSPARVLIIGYGNPLRSDDGLGCHAAHLLHQQYACESGLAIIACQQLTPELALHLAPAERVIFLDAACPTPHLPPGCIRCQQLVPVAPRSQSSTHHLHPAALLACAHLLYGAAPVAFLLSVAGSSFAYGSSFSPPVAAALPHLLHLTGRLLA